MITLSSCIKIDHQDDLNGKYLDLVVTRLHRTDVPSVCITSLDQTPPSWSACASSLRFLSVIETSQIPLHVIVGQPFPVTTNDVYAQSWLSTILCGQSSLDSPAGQEWWTTSVPQSPLGILLGLDNTSATQLGPCVTELLVYAAAARGTTHRPLTPPTSSPPHDEGPWRTDEDLSRISVYAVALSSELLYRSAHFGNTPPASPLQCEDDSVHGRFLNPLNSPCSEIIHEPPVKRRRTAADAFDEADERKKAIHRPGLMTLPKTTEPQFLTLKHRRSASNGSGIVQPRTLSRSPSITSTKQLPSAPSRSSLSRVESASNLDLVDSTTETKNRDLISRIVMAGMRLFGLSQSKPRRSRRPSCAAADSPHPELSHDQAEAERLQNEQFKLIYHQVFKGVCFAFRRSITTDLLVSHADVVREVADKFLVLFCNNPLAAEHKKTIDEVEMSPGGRKVLVGGVVSDDTSNEPFLGT